MSGLWGEIPSAPEADSGIAALERDELTKPRPIEPEAPPLFQPSSRHYPPSNEPLPAKFFQMDPVVMHTIRLIEHARKTRTAIQTVQQQQAEGKSGEDAFPTVPPIPEYDGPPLKHTAQPPLMYMAPDLDNDFAAGRGDRIPEIDEVTNRNLLKRSVGTILAHASFEGSREHVLDTLTDVAAEYFLNLTTILRNAADDAAMHGLSGFSDILQQAFYEVGIGDISTLHDYYTTEVLQYNRDKMDTCKQLVAELEKLKQPVPVSQSPSTSATVTQKDTFNVIRIKEEPSADIQFPVLDENSEVSEAEQLLQLEGLGSFEITVEHETAGGLTTEVESKWPQSVKMEQDKTKSVESSDEAVNVTDTSGSVGGQDSDPRTPRTPRDLPDPSDPEPGPSSPRSPPSSAGASRPKKRKTTS
ncbi:STAGA complex 65 subunit gamma-like [Babylonia areolata]|uniref:STAGA complex 65 subunit gamma-like n=1 Tax=Babylonia areolata TaxID=304850 RepID=UPI003FD329D2